MCEIWQDVIGYEGIYQASSEGRIKSIERCSLTSDGNLKRLKSKIIKASELKGYMGCTLCKNGKQKRFQVHRLVAMAFIPNPENKPQVNHINGIKDDNRATNLEWNTSRENLAHAYKTGLKKGMSSDRARTAKISYKKAAEIRALYKSGEYNQEEIAKRYGLALMSLNRIVLNKTWADKEYKSIAEESISGAALKAARKAKGYRAKELAIRVGMSISYISTLENGSKMIKGRTMHRLMNALK